MTEHYRLCTANDRDGMIAQLAGDLWNSRRQGMLDDRPWDGAGEYWQRIFRELAVTAVGSLAQNREDECARHCFSNTIIETVELAVHPE